MKYKTTIAASLLLLLSGLAAATHTAEIQANPANKTVLATNSTINGSNVSTNTFSFPVRTENNSIVADIPLSIPAGVYDGRIELENNYSHNFTVRILPYVNWSLTPDRIEDTINVGTSGKLTGQTISLTGNTNTTIDVSITGNVSKYLQVTDQVTVYPDINSSVVLQYNVRETTEYGLYNGTLQLNGSYNHSQQVPVRLQFKDNVTPVIQDVETPSFTATFPENFTVKASDNLNITAVEAEILNETTVRSGNTTKRVNKTIETLSYTKIKNTQKWTARPPTETPGTFYVDGYVVDGAGNRVNFTSKYTVDEIDAVEVNSSISLQNYRVESEIVEKIGKIDRETPLEIRLESFSQPLQSPNETWNLAIKTRDGEKFLRNENHSVTVEGPTPVYLKLYGNVPERFNGRLSFEGVKQHVPIDDVRFNGQYLQCKVPKKEVITVFDRNVTYSPVNSDSCEKAGWRVSYFISADMVPIGSNLKQSARVFIPEQVQEETEDFRENEKQRLKEKAADNAFWGKVFLVFGLFGWGAFLWERRVAPSWYYTRLKTTDLLSTDFLGGDDDEDGIFG